jgi:hypothetical protein
MVVTHPTFWKRHGWHRVRPLIKEKGIHISHCKTRKSIVMTAEPTPPSVA